MQKLVEVSPYTPEWPEIFAKEALGIRNELKELLLDLQHIGSTAVPGLIAKPIIDMVLVVKDPTLVIKPLEALGYVYKGEVNIPFRYYFSKKSPYQVHLHVYEEGHPEIELNLLFRNYLRANPEACEAYANLKNLLIQEQHTTAQTGRFSSYTLGKYGLIKSIQEQTGFDRLRILHCTNPVEWDLAKTFRQRYFFDHAPMADPYTWTFNHPEHSHFALYKGLEIRGYAHIQHWPEGRAAMRIFVIDEPFRNQGFGGEFLGLCEKWMKKHEFKSVHLESNQEALNFYKTHGFSEMPFGDPNGNPTDVRDTPLGKVL